jgi:hypothetical protein
MCRESATGRHGIVIDYAQVGYSHVLEIVVTAEGKSVVAVEPAMIGVTSVVCFTYCQHFLVLLESEITRVDGYNLLFYSGLINGINGNRLLP